MDPAYGPLKSRVSKDKLQEVRDENYRLLNQIRVTGSLPMIYRELVEDFPKVFQIFSGNVFL